MIASSMNWQRVNKDHGVLLAITNFLPNDDGSNKIIVCVKN